jgi:hypothetical protein
MSSVITGLEPVEVDTRHAPLINAFYPESLSAGSEAILSPFAGKSNLVLCKVHSLAGITQRCYTRAIHAFDRQSNPLEVVRSVKGVSELQFDRNM